VENHVFLPVQIAVSLRGLGSFVFQRDEFAGIVLNISFFDAAEEGGDISFGRTNFFDFPSFFPYDKT